MAKRSRRSRRQETEQPKVVTRTVPETKTPVNVTSRAKITPQTEQKILLDLAHDYAYVYRELRNVLVITVVMFVLMISLGFVI